MAEGPSIKPEGTCQAKPELSKVKQERKERKLRLVRCLTDGMLEEYRPLSQESNMYKRPYEEAAFKVYGTLPPGKVFYNAAMKYKRGPKTQNKIN